MTKTQKEYTNTYRVKHPAMRLWSVAKQRAKKRNVEFTITPEDIVLVSKCPVFNIDLQVNIDKGAGGKDNSYSLDRIDQSKGYIPGNVQVISHKANSMKFTASKEELLLFAKWIIKEYDDTNTFSVA